MREAGEPEAPSPVPLPSPRHRISQRSISPSSSSLGLRRDDADLVPSPATLAAGGPGRVPVPARLPCAAALCRTLAEGSARPRQHLCGVIGCGPAVAPVLVCRKSLAARTAPCLCLRATVQLRLHRQSCLNLHFHRSSARSTPACTFSIAVVAPALRVCVVLFCRKSFPARTAPCLSMFASVHLRRYLQNRPHLHLHLHPHLYIQQHCQMSRQ